MQMLSIDNIQLYFIIASFIYRNVNNKDATLIYSVINRKKRFFNAFSNLRLSYVKTLHTAILFIIQFLHYYLKAFYSCFQIFDDVVCQHIRIGQIVQIGKTFIF